MTVDKFQQAILDTLQGQTDELRTIPGERLDWSGPGAFLELYRKTSGSDRMAMIKAVSQVIQGPSTPIPVLAQLVQIASSLDLAELEPQIRELQAQSSAVQEPLRGAISNYLAFRRLNLSAETVAPLPARKEQRRDHKARLPNDGNGQARRAK